MYFWWTWEYLDFVLRFFGKREHFIRTLTSIFRAFQSKVLITCVCRKISDRTAGFVFDLTQNFFSLVNIFVQNSTALAAYVYVYTCSVYECMRLCLYCSGYTRVSTIVDVSCEACIRHYELKMFTPLLCGKLPYPLESMC